MYERAAAVRARDTVAVAIVAPHRRTTAAAKAVDALLAHFSVPSASRELLWLLPLLAGCTSHGRELPEVVEPQPLASLVGTAADTQLPTIR
jgi:hypothetical protein